MKMLLCLVVLALAGQAAESREAPKAKSPSLENGSFIAELNSHKIHYEVHGRGPVLMTVPNSWGLTLEGLRALYQPLEAHLTLVYFDPRGMGGSGPIREPAEMGMAAVRADFQALRKRLGLDRVNVIGWSNGAIDLIFLASEQPETLSAAIFLHGNPRFGPEDMKGIAARYPDLLKHFADFRGEMQGTDIPEAEKDARTKEFDVKVWFPYMFADQEAGRGALPVMYKDTGFSWRHAQYADEDLPAPYDLRDRLPKVTAPSLVIAGRHDMLPPERGEEIHAGIPGSTFVVFEKSGHFAPVEERVRFQKTVLEFLGVKGP